jgi:uncharacterized protein DUF5671
MWTVLFSSLIQVAILGGIALLIVRVASGRSRTSSEGIGVLIRRIFVYALMLTMLALAGIGVAGLIDAAWPTSNALTESASRTAISIAFVVVALPVFLGLAYSTRRRLSNDSDEQNSAGWAFYLTVALVGSLLASMALFASVLADLARNDTMNRAALIQAVTWTSIWAGHWRVSRRWVPKRSAQTHILLGAAIGLVWAAAGASALLTAALSTIYDTLFLTSIVDRGASELLRPLTVLVVGAPVWWWYWIRHARQGQRTPWWLAYVLLLGVLGGAVASISGLGTILFGVLEWILDTPQAGAGAHFAFLPGATTGVVVGCAAWLYHTAVLGSREERRRSEVGRVHDYLLAGAGFAVATSGAATLLATAIKSFSGATVVTSSNGTALAAAITLITVGSPLWLHYWMVTQRFATEDDSREVHSITRRAYILIILGVAGVIAVVSAIVLVFVVFEDILDGTLATATIDAVAVPFALLATAGLAAWYHFAVFREDRGVFDATSIQPVLREVTIVGSIGDGLADSIREATGAVVRSMRRTGDPTVVGSTEDLVEFLKQAEHERVAITPIDGDFHITPIDK